MYVAEPPSYLDLEQEISGDRFTEILRQQAPLWQGSDREYLHWDRLRHLDPPGDLSHREWWYLLKFARRPMLRQIPLRDSEGRSFWYATPDEALRLLHLVDQRCSGEIAMPEVVTADEQARQHYLVNSLMEEAIRSSQLEGATTSRRVAKDLLRSRRRPKDRSERMIVNHYDALQFMREHMGRKLTPAIVLELHRILTEGTLDNPDAAGRLQRPDEDRVAVHDRADGKVIHRPPPAEQLPERLETLCRFANQTSDDKQFIHPVIRAVLLHFWMGYEHPFEDGNGRTARTLFYWSMREQGYWLAEYLSISKILRNAPAKYARAFVLSETDEGDTTHFVLYQLHVIERAIKELHTYLRRKVAEVRDVEQLIRGSARFNHRQLALLGDAMRTPGQSYTFRSHASSHNVTHETARRDLGELQERGLFERRRMGRRHVFVPVADLSDRLQRAA
jgi:Fic family protein